MHIEKTSTPDFENYEVLVNKPSRTPLWDKMFGVNREEKLTNILECDDSTGLIVRHIINEHGEPIFTNGLEDIALSNEVKLLLLLPQIREAFLRSGFVPKVIRTYEKNVRIINKNPTVAIAVEVQQSLETANA